MFDITTEESVREILAQYGPKNLEIQEIQSLKDGWKNNVFLINQNLIVRFPKTNQIDLVKEAKLLDIIHLHTDLKTPKVEYVHFSPSFILYEYIPGEILERSDLSKINFKKCAIDLAKFFAQFHELSNLSYINEMELKEYNYLKEFSDAVEESDFILQNLSELETQLSKYKLEITKLENFIKKWRTVYLDFLSSEKYLTRLIHDDLHRKNIIFNQNYEICGIIDFDEIKLGDIHLDFCNLIYSFDIPTVKLVLEEYFKLTGLKVDFDKSFSMGVNYTLSNIFRNFEAPEDLLFEQSLDLILGWIKAGY